MPCLPILKIILHEKVVSHWRHVPTTRGRNPRPCIRGGVGLTGRSEGVLEVFHRERPFLRNHAGGRVHPGHVCDDVALVRCRETALGALVQDGRPLRTRKKKNIFLFRISPGLGPATKNWPVLEKRRIFFYFGYRPVWALRQKIGQYSDRLRQGTVSLTKMPKPFHTTIHWCSECHMTSTVRTTIETHLKAKCHGTSWRESLVGLQ